MIYITLIPEDFKPNSANSNYLKLTVGKHRIRILDGALAGYSWWTEESDGGRKPHRIDLTKNPPSEFGDSVRKFLAFPIWNHDLNKIQIWEATQSSIQTELQKLDRDKDWGELSGYDIEVERTGADMMTTRYRITPKPKSKLSDKVLEELKVGGLPNMAALLVGEDPFSETVDFDIDSLPF